MDKSAALEAELHISQALFFNLNVSLQSIDLVNHDKHEIRIRKRIATSRC